MQPFGLLPHQPVAVQETTQINSTDFTDEQNAKIEKNRQAALQKKRKRQEMEEQNRLEVLKEMEFKKDMEEYNMHITSEKENESVGRKGKEDDDFDLNAMMEDGDLMDILDEW